MKTLREVKSGETATVVKLNGEGAVKRRIMDVATENPVGSGGPEAFFSRVGFVPVDETEYGEVIAEIRL